MSDSYINRYPWRSLGWFILGIVCLLVVMQGWRYIIKPDLTQKDEIIASSLDETAAVFVNRQYNLLKKTEEIVDKLRTTNLQDSSLKPYHVLQNYPDLWGAMLVKDGRPIVWQGFSLGFMPLTEHTADTVKSIAIKKQNNVIFWLAHTAFKQQTGQQEPVVYHLYAAERIAQANALNIGGSQEYHFIKSVNSAYDYPLSISLLEPPPAQRLAYKVLRNVMGDSVGVASAVPGHFEQLSQSWKQENKTWHSIFAIFCFVAFLVFVTFWIDLEVLWLNMVIRMFFVLCGWSVFNYVSISTRWLPGLLESLPVEMIHSYQLLCEFGINALFLFLLAYTIHRTLNNVTNKYHRVGSVTAVIGGIIIGIISMVLILGTFTFSSSLILDTSFPLLNLQIIPSTGIILLYIALGLMLWGIALLILNFNRYIFRNGYDYYKQAWLCSLAGFIIAFVFINFMRGDFIISWPFYTALFFYGFIGGISFIYFVHQEVINHSSALRNVAIAGFFLAAAGTVIIYFNQLKNQDEELAKIARIYSQQEDEYAQTLVKDLLKKLHKQFRPVAIDSLKSETSGIEGKFTQVIRSSLGNKNNLYKLHFQLITAEGKKLATYSNALDVPEWVNYFNHVQFYSTILMQGINENYIIPVVQQPVLTNQNEYKTFYRGWIPFYDSTQNVPAVWVVGSVYQKRFDYKKPFQAVLASYNNRNQSNPAIVQHYRNNRLISTIYKGAGRYFPIYNRLPVKITQHSDSLHYYNNKSSQYSYRNLIVDKPDGNVLKVSTILPSFQNLLFTFFRFHLTLILFGFAASLLFQLISRGQVILVNRNTQFRYRILDSFLLSTLAFLILLIIGTYYTLNKQNQNLVKQQLYETLESIQLTTTDLSSLQEDGSSFTSILGPQWGRFNSDVSFYEDKTVVNTTTPQLYSQHIIPSAIPFPVYHQLYINKKRGAIQSINLFGQQLFVGYRLFFNDDKEPIAAIGIPAFAKSPVYQSWLLETSSLLVLFYVVVFGLFIIGAIFISHQLTQPLYEIRRGLYRISKGDLDQTIPVKSKDEIGILASSYNRMAGQLKKLQAELAKSEREAGWKEIAREAAHEIKNPLTPMKLNVQHLRQQAASGKADAEELKLKIAQVTKNMLIQIDSLNTIAYNFLTYSASKSKEFKPVNIHQLITQIVTLHKNTNHKKIEQELTHSPAIVKGDKDELYSAIFNLVKNAYEASSDDSVIQVKTYTKDNRICIEVHNEGEPIPVDTQKNIFAPNFSTKSGGTGLGLTICKKVVTLHDGEITFESTKEDGTTFTIKLPLEYEQ